MSGLVSLVGAGCGPADLITLRGLERLRRADAVVYDDLIDEDLLALARPGAALIYAGKRSGRHSMAQPEICALLADLARQQKRVCRLKGGDPFVFGRGGEELAALRAQGIPCEAVPGVTSAIAVPARGGIPVTHRGVSRSFHVVTAHTADTPDGLPGGLDVLARTGGTLVFLMGLSSLAKLAARLIAAGMPGNTPAAVAGEATVRGTLADIAEKARGALPPAVVVVGAAAGMDVRVPSPLGGATIGITGTAGFRSKLRAAMEPLGAEVACLQRSAVRRVCTKEELCAALRKEPGWIAFTSPNGVDVFFDLLAGCRRDVRSLAAVKFAAVGNGTAEALACRGIYADLVPGRHDTAALGDALAARCGAGSRVLLACADNASCAPREKLEAAGAAVFLLTCYRIEAGPVLDLRADYVAFGSAGGVEQYFEKGGRPPARAAVCIGDVAARAARKMCGRVLVAADADAGAMAKAVLDDWEAGGV